MINFRELVIGDGSKHVAVEELAHDIEALAPEPVMMTGFEPFEHPNLVEIIHVITGAGIRQIGMRTNASALANPRDALGCIDTGVRVFEVLLPPMPPVGETLALREREASLQGIRQIRKSAEALGVTVFISLLLSIDGRAPSDYVLKATQASIAADADAIRIACAEPSHFIDQNLLHDAHGLATQAGIAFFGDGCEAYLKGARLYEVMS